MKMIEEIIKYAEQSGAQFVTDLELARLSETGFLKPDADYDNPNNL
jgi:hypothetical protein